MPQNRRLTPWWRRLYWGNKPLARAVAEGLAYWHAQLTRRKLYWGGVPLSEASISLLQKPVVQRLLKFTTLVLFTVSVVGLLLPGPVIKQLGLWLSSMFAADWVNTPRWPHADKLTHAAIFMLLTLAIRVSWLNLSAQTAALLLLILALATELLQLPIPGRTGTLGDVAADGVGIAVGSVLLWWLWPWLLGILTKPAR